MKNAIIAAVVSALVSAAGGSAATRYIISSTAQIKPSVLRTLERHNSQSVAPAAPAPGPQGERGPEGKPGATGLTGGQGPGGESIRGPKGEPGPQGDLGINRIQQAEATGPSLAPGEHRTEGLEVHCPESGTPIGGGYETSDPHIHVYGSHAAGNWGWTVSAVNESTINEGTVTVHAICAL